MGSSGLYSNSLGSLRSQTILRARRLSTFHRSHAYNRSIDKRRERHMAWVRETIPCIQDQLLLTLICSSSSYMTVQLEYFDGLVVSTHLIKPDHIGHIRV